MHRLCFALATSLFLFLGYVPSASAQVKAGRAYYEDDSDLGFKFKPPAGWDFIPAQPSEVNLIGKYEPERNKGIQIGGGQVLLTKFWLLKFDKSYKREKLAKGASREDAIKAASKDYHKDLPTWIKANGEVGSEMSLADEGPFRLAKEEAVEIVYAGKSPQLTNGSGGAPIHLWAVRIKMDENRDLVFAANAPADKKKWSKWQKDLRKLVKTFKRVEIEEPAAVTGDNVGMGGLRAKKRAEIQKRLRTEPGWTLYETPNYFVVTSHEDKKFVEEMMDRLESIREVYEADYPIEKAMEARKAKEAREAKAGEKEKGGDGAAQDPTGAGRTTAARADPMEESKTSVVRLCKNKTEYMAYGGSARSAGYWSWVAEELVIFDDQESGGRRNTWAVLNHEAFHQYIFYFYGNISPHSWYNEGTGDFYSGFQLDGRKKFKLSRFDWRESTIKEEIKKGKIAPLKDLVRWSQAQYYGNNPIDGGSGSRYPQGWSLVYFLRTGKANKAKGWDDSWGSILETYLDALAETGDLDQAVERAYAGVDWDALETAWKNYILKGK